MNKPPKLIKIRIIVDTEIVAENFYGDDLIRCGREAWLENWGDILLDADIHGEIKMKITPILKKEHLPIGWSKKHRPYQPNIKYGKKEGLKNTIGKLLKDEENT